MHNPRPLAERCTRKWPFRNRQHLRGEKCKIRNVRAGGGVDGGDFEILSSKLQICIKINVPRVTSRLFLWSWLTLMFPPPKPIIGNASSFPPGRRSISLNPVRETFRNFRLFRAVLIRIRRLQTKCLGELNYTVSDMGTNSIFKGQILRIWCFLRDRFPLHAGPLPFSRRPREDLAVRASRPTRPHLFNLPRRLASEYPNTR